MNTLTATIAVPQINKMRVVRVAPDVDDGAIYINVQVLSTAGVPYPGLGSTYQLVARNGQSQGIRQAVAPVGFNDRVELFTLTTATAFTDILAAYVAAGAALLAKNTAVESALVTAGMMPAGTVA